MQKEKFKVGLNRSFIGKPSKTVQVNQAIDWVPSEISTEELIEHVCSGYGFTAHFRNSYRKTKNFICSDIVAADFDGNLTLEEAQELPFIKQFASFLYTTPSHTVELNRFRAVFLLEEGLDLAQNWADCLFGLAINLNSDRSIKDAGRMFYGSLDCDVVKIGNLLPAVEVEKLIVVGRDNRGRSKHWATAHLPITSSHKLHADQLISLQDGDHKLFSTLAPDTNVRCPFHADEHPSAFVVQSNKGTNGIHCMACNSTYWAGDSEDYDFEAFDRLIVERRTKDQQKNVVNERDPNPFASYFPDDPKVIVHRKKYLPNLVYHSGITLVKSPKGSGKTEALAALIKQVRQGLFPYHPDKTTKPKSVLLIGHRQSLIREAAARLGLDCYLDDEKTGAHRRKRFGYAICLDSLHKIAIGSSKAIAPSTYDVIILDESEQVISHLLSDTLRERNGMSGAFSSLEYMIRRAKAVYALDADLGLITLQAMKALRPADWEHNLQIIHNEPIEVTERQKMSIYKSKKDLQDRMIASIKEGKRCFIASNSKRTVDVLEQLIFKECGPSVPMVAITSDNSRGQDETFFVENIQTEYLKKQVLICSPSLGTGIDISFPKGKCEVDEVFGFFSPHVNKHTDIDQQLARVRKPGAVSVWFDGSVSNFEANVDVVKRQLALANYVPSALKNRLDNNGIAEFDSNDPLLNIATHVMVAHRSSQNRITTLFKQLRQSNGWDIETVEKQPKTAGNIKWADAQRVIKDRKIEGILGAKPLDDIQASELSVKLSRGNQLTQEERFSQQRYELEQAYHCILDRSLIERDNDGKLRSQIAVYREIFQYQSATQGWIDQIQTDLEGSKPLAKTSISLLVATAMTTAGLMQYGKILRDKHVISADLEAFKNMCSNNRVMIEDVLQTSLRSDLTSNPVRQLNVFLGKCGFTLTAMKRRQVNGQTSIRYKLDAGKIKLMEDLA
jgi:hypothetical protein